MYGSRAGPETRGSEWFVKVLDMVSLNYFMAFEGTAKKHRTDCTGEETEDRFECLHLSLISQVSNCYLLPPPG